MGSRKTIFLDIDGTILKHGENIQNMIRYIPYDLDSEDDIGILDGVLQKLQDWHEKDYYVIITTARPESMRDLTSYQLSQNGIFYNKLIMNLPSGCRVVINDRKPDGTVTALAYCLNRNEGLAKVDI